ncbi:MAG: DUF2339 domain-containing protein [Sandaracinus sp.]|nr:DUF2339 domain-containing protein [Sandaracinus sp.]
MATPSPARPPVAPAPTIEWEQWLGIRGAAALGALVLTLAGLYFFQYSIEHGLISPALRVVLGVGVGLGCVAASEARLRHSHPTLAQWLTGAGVAILYVAFWAGRALYDLYPAWAASAAMIATTAACVTLASTRRSTVVAALGLFGGFVTPLALSTGEDRPFSLFGYLLLLDVAMLWLAYRRRWAWLAIASLVGTTLYQLAWLIVRLDGPRMALGAGIVALFAAIFALLPRRDDEGALWRGTRTGGVVVALVFSLYLAVRGDLHAHFEVSAPLLLALCAGSAWLALRARSPELPFFAAFFVVVAAFAASDGWEAALLLLGAASIFQMAAERAESAHNSAVAAVLGGLGVVVVRANLDAPWPSAISLAVLTAIGLRQARRWPLLGLFVGCSVGVAASFATLPRFGLATEPPATTLLGLAIVLVALPSALTFFRNVTAEHRRGVDHGALAAPLILALGLPFASGLVALPEHVFFVGLGLCVVLASLAASRLRRAWPLLAIVLVHVCATGLFVVRGHLPFTIVTWLGTLAPALFGLAFGLARRAFVDDPWRWRSAALAGPLALPAAREVHLAVFGAETVGLVALLLAALAAFVLWLAYRRGPRDAAARRSALAWTSAATASLVTVAIPIQLENEWVTIGWALEAFAIALVWRRLDHAGLKYFALALVAAVGIRLVGNPYVLDYYPRGAWRVLNWLSYAYLVPVLALVGAWKVLNAHERERLRPWETEVFGRRAFVATSAAATALVVLFAWLNLTIVDVFAEGRALTLDLQRLPARDLSLSLAWGVYALFLLALGMRRDVVALRATSLVLVLATSAKVFLYDLAYLRDLYRVGSLVGLALALLAISFVYQRFVFRSAEVAR